MSIKTNIYYGRCRGNTQLVWAKYENVQKTSKL